MTYAYDPTPHQRKDKRTLLEIEGGLLWADPGTGKTFTAIMAMKEAGFKRVVIVCPKIAIQMWYDEITLHLKDWWPYRINSARFGKNSRIFQRKALIVSYDMWTRNADVQRLIERYLQGFVEFRANNTKLPGWDYKTNPTLVIADEAHYLKNTGSKRFKTLIGRPQLTLPGKMLRAGEIWQLTGTPITRHLDDLYAQLFISRRDVLKHYKVDGYPQFRDKFCTTQWKSYHPRQPKKQVVTGSKNLELMEQLLQDCVVIRRRLVDVVDDLPAITYRSVSASYKGMPKIKLPTSQADLIRELNKADSMLSKARRLLGMAKTADVVDYIKEAHTGPMLVGFWHTDVGGALLESLGDDLKIGYIDGGTPDAARNQYIADFNAGKLDILLGQMKAMGVAANLQGASSHVIVAEEMPSQADLEQFVARVHRRGQKHHVQVDLIRSDHEIDAALAGLRAVKGKVAHTFL